MRKRSDIEKDIRSAINLAGLSRKLLNETCSELAPFGDDGLQELMDNIQEGSRTDIQEIMKELEADGYLSHFEDDGCTPDVPEISIDTGYGCNVEVKVPVDGGKLVIGNCQSDLGTKQAYMMYEHNGTQVDLALAEVKRGELAKISGMAEDNKDVSLYVWSDVFSEDPTDHFVVKHPDIEKALN